MRNFPPDFEEKLRASGQGLLAYLKSEWDEAEKVIKLAEDACGKVVEPSINELRYAGRRLVDSLDAYLGLKRPDIKDPERAQALLRDAIFDCHRARHDAVDAASAKIVGNLALATDRLGHDIVLRSFPEFPELLQRVARIRTRIAVSRGDRDNWDNVYKSIVEDDFPRLTELYANFRASEEMMISLAEADRQEKIEIRNLREKEKKNTRLTIILAVLAIVVSLAAWLLPIKNP